MAANKVPGVLAATCHDLRTARNSREHNGANVLCIGSGTLDEAAFERSAEITMEGGMITEMPEGAYTHEITDQALN